MKQSVRIIGGHFRGKKLSFPDLEGLRPTSSRVRETLFNWLMHDIQGACCLDAFAGSGALGLEALSRGAREVTLVEASNKAFRALEKSAEALSPSAGGELLLVLANAEQFLKKTQKIFDIIFFDPPFAYTKLEDCLSFLAQAPCLPSGGLVYIEAPCKLSLDPKIWEEKKLQKAGQVKYGLWKKI